MIALIAEHPIHKWQNAAFSSDGKLQPRRTLLLHWITIYFTNTLGSLQNNKMVGGKRKSEPCAGDTQPKRFCFLHYPESTNDHFTHLNSTPDPTGTLKLLNELKDERLAEEIGSKLCFEDVCSQIPPNSIDIDDNKGYHRNCYKKFTRLLLIQAVKTNNFDLYKYCLYNMIDIFFAFNGTTMPDI